MLDLKNISKQKYAILIFVLFFFLLFLSFHTTYKTIDPDFGWHLKTGQLILERGVPKVDWYSYTMPKYPWIDHEWLIDVFIYKIYSLFGFQILLAIFLSVFTLAFIILIKRKTFSYFLLPVFLGYAASLCFLGIRPQLFSVFFVAILFLILNKFLNNPSTKLIYFCPFLFLLWVNLHGGFLIGLLLIFISLCLEIFKKTKFFEKLLTIKIFEGQTFKPASNRKIIILSVLFLICIFTTFINPYGIGLYKSPDFSAMGDSFVRFHIGEWLPLFFSGWSLSTFIIMLYVTYFLGLLIIYYKKIDFNNLIVSLFFLFFALSSQRNFIVFVILTISVFAELTIYFNNGINIKFFTDGLTKFKKWLIIVLIFGIVTLVFFQYFTNVLMKKNQNKPLEYPEKAINFLKTLPASDNLLNEYNWGGYLIWKVPERKYFIDGRMPSWRDKDTESLLKKYDIKIILLSEVKKERALEYIKYQKKPKNKFSAFFDKYKWINQILGISLPQKNIYNLLINSNWKTIYEDNVAVILEKK